MENCYTKLFFLHKLGESSLAKYVKNQEEGKKEFVYDLLKMERVFNSFKLWEILKI